MVTKPQYTTTVWQITKQQATTQITQAPPTTKLTTTVLPTTARLQQTSRMLKSRIRKLILIYEYIPLM